MTPSDHTIAIVEDDSALANLLEDEILSHGYNVVTFNSAEAFSAHHPHTPFSLVITDIKLPGISGLALLENEKRAGTKTPFLIITAFGTVNQAVEALKKGADDFLTKPLNLEHLLFTVKRIISHTVVVNEVNQLKKQVSHSFYGIVGKSRIMRQMYDNIERVSAVDSAVLITGESGTGKELVARAIHDASPRKNSNFVAVNCAGIPPDLIESEFFGHVSGAFSGAQRSRNGLFKEADGGTLLLDEIGEMPMSLQAKLLRVLQENTIRPIGSDSETSINVRIIAATHKNLEAMSETGAFREDLFFRLETLKIAVPPLRERGDDLELLVDFFLSQLANAQNKQVGYLSSDAWQLLYDYPFPGNVRELGNAIERAFIFTTGQCIEAEHLPDRIKHYRNVGQPEHIAEHTEPTMSWLSLQEYQKRYVSQVMKHTKGNKAKAAEILGITRRTLYRWLD